MAEPRRTAHWWVTSQDPTAQQWREAARGGAFLGMVNRALSDHEKGKIFGQPHPETHSVIEQPATVAQNYFQVPEQPVQRGNYFNIPVKEIGPGFRGQVQNDWLSEEGVFVQPSWEDEPKKQAQPTKAAQAATYFSIPEGA